MADVNSVVYTGRLTRDVETKDIGGTAICNFAIAVGSWSKSKGDEVSFFDCTAFGHDANFLAKYAKKGSQLTVQGENKQERWEKDGKTLSKVVLKVNRLSLAGGRGNEEAGSTKGKENTSDGSFTADGFISEIPF